MQQNDGAAKLRLGLHGFKLRQHRLSDLVGLLAGILVPIVSIDLVADNGVSIALNAHHRRGLIVGVGFLVDVVRRTEIERLHAQLAGEQAAGKLYFQVQLPRRNFADVGMRPRVVADLVALARNPLQHTHIPGGICADDHESALRVFLLQDVKNLRRPLGVGAVIERQCNLIGMVAVLLNRVGARVHIHVLIHNELFARVILVGVHGDRALARLWQSGHAQNVSFALGVHVVSRLHRAERLQRFRSARLVPDVPERAVFLTKSPKCKCLQTQSAGRPHLIQQRDSIQKPNYVALIAVLVYVLVVRIE